VQTLSAICFREMFWTMTLRELVSGGAARPSEDGTLLAMLRAARDEQTGETLSEQEIHDQCMIGFQAGHETTATALLWWSALMVRHPEAMARAQAEVDDACGAGALAPERLAALPWLGATLKEATRLYPPVAVLMTRRATRAIELGGYELPARTLLRFTPWVLHRDPRWFEDPETFRPGRFEPGAPEVPRGAYLPFGVGPRVCLGQHLATLEMTLVAARLLRAFTLRLPPGTASAMPAPRLHVTLRPAEPVTLLLRRR